MAGLQPMDPNSRAATVLGDGGPSALEVAYKRKGIEMDLAKNLAAQKAAKDATKAKEKIADDKAHQEWMKTLPSTSKLQHSIEYAKLYRESVGTLGKIFRENGGMPKMGTPGWEQAEKIKANLLQISNNSTQMDEWGKAALAQIEANRASGNVIYTSDAEPKVRAQASNYENITNGILGTMPKNIVDTEAMVRKAFYGYEYDVSAWENLTKNGEGIRGGTREFVPPNDLKQAAEAIGANAVFAEEVKDRLSNPELMLPERAKFITDEAKRLKITPAAMYALDYATGLYDHVKSTASYKEAGTAGYGMKKEEIGAINFIEKGIGMNDPSNKGKSLAELGIRDMQTTTNFLKSNPGIQKFSVNIPKNSEIFTGYNGMVYDTKTDEEGHERNRYVTGIARDPQTGDMVVITTDAKDRDLKVSKPIPSERFFSEVMDPIATYHDELDHKAVGYFYQKDYGPIKNKEGNIPLPKSGVGGGNESAGLYNPLTGKAE